MNRIKITLLLVPFLALTSCAMRENTRRRVHQPWEPEAFEFAIMPAPIYPDRYKLKWDGSCLVEREETAKVIFGRWQDKTTKNRRYHPSKEQWEAFWADVERLKLTKWHKRYLPSDVGEHVFDGASWSFHARHGDIIINTSGDNAGPDPRNPRQTVVGFKASAPLANAINELKEHQ